MPRRVFTLLGAAASAVALGSLIACTSPSDAAAAGPGDMQQCLTDHGVPAGAAKPPQGPPGGGQPPDGPPPGEPPQGAPPPGQRSAPPAPAGVDEGVWNDAFAACAELAPHPPPR